MASTGVNKSNAFFALRHKGKNKQILMFNQT